MFVFVVFPDLFRRLGFYPFWLCYFWFMGVTMTFLHLVVWFVLHTCSCAKQSQKTQAYASHSGRLHQRRSGWIFWELFTVIPRSRAQRFQTLKTSLFEENWVSKLRWVLFKGRRSCHMIFGIKPSKTEKLWPQRITVESFEPPLFWCKFISNKGCFFAAKYMEPILLFLRTMELIGIPRKVVVFRI